MPQQIEETLIPEEIYNKYLSEINGIKFTPREIDIMSSALHCKSIKMIAQFFSNNQKSLSIKSVESHVSNIRRKISGGSKDTIISFIEKSDKYKYFIKYHQALLIEKEFYQKIIETKAVLSSFNFKLALEEKPEDKSNNLNYFKNYLIKYLNELSNPDSKITITISLVHSLYNPVKITDNSIIYIVNASDETELSEFFKEKKHIKLQANFYFFFWEMLALIFPDKSLSIGKISQGFNERYNSIGEFSYNKTIKLSPTDIVLSPKLLFKFIFGQKKNRYFFIIFLIVSLTFYGSFKYSYKNNGEIESIKKQAVIKSDLLTPNPSVFLERPEILKKIKERLKGDDGIKTVALTGIVGIGGAGKTTIARHYAKDNDASVIWEINAETKETLINSFRNLAYIIANTEDLKKELNFIQQVQEPESKEKLLLEFVKTNLKSRKNWVLIYDNMESFSEINHLFPHDSKQWGKGKVIITTRNENITALGYINPENVIYLDELSEQEKIKLFSKILYDLEPNKLSEKSYNMVVSFLKNIPPFPLDVSVAAYSIKNTHVTFEQYIKHIAEYTKSYETMQIKILKETTDYSKTRYGIISSTVEKMNRINPKFKNLFFLICLVDSQNIPHQLLEYFNDSTMVDDFEYNLRNNGLLLREANGDFAHQSKGISLHRSTQEIGAEFLLNSFSNQQKEFLIDNIIDAVNNYYKSCIKSKDITAIITLIPHINTLLNNIHNISLSHDSKCKFETKLYFMLGSINFKWTKNIALAKEYFEIALEKDDNKYLSARDHALLLKDLASSCLTMNLIEQSFKYAEESIALCKIFSNSESIISENLQIIGTYYRKKNNFSKALEALNNSLKAISVVKTDDAKKITAEIYIQLSHLYLMHFLHKPEGRPAQDNGINALKLLNGNEFFYQNPTAPLPPYACEIARHRWKYAEVFMWHNVNFEEADKNLLEAEYIMKRKCIGDMHLKGRIYGLQGEIYLRKHMFPEALDKLNESINTLNIALGPNTTWTYSTRRAEVNIRLGNYTEAYNDCDKVFKVGQIERTNFHDIRYYMAIYHAAYSKYKLKDYKKSLALFADFINKMKQFSYEFLDENSYNKLNKAGVFSIYKEASEDQILDIENYLKNSLSIFSIVLPKNHPFVDDYVAKNIEK